MVNDRPLKQSKKCKVANKHTSISYILFSDNLVISQDTNENSLLWSSRYLLVCDSFSFLSWNVLGDTKKILWPRYGVPVHSTHHEISIWFPCLK